MQGSLRLALSKKAQSSLMKNKNVLIGKRARKIWQYFLYGLYMGALPKHEIKLPLPRVISPNESVFVVFVPGRGSTLTSFYGRVTCLTKFETSWIFIHLQEAHAPILWVPWKISPTKVQKPEGMDYNDFFSTN